MLGVYKSKKGGSVMYSSMSIGPSFQKGISISIPGRPEITTGLEKADGAVIRVLADSFVRAGDYSQPVKPEQASVIARVIKLITGVDLPVIEEPKVYNFYGDRVWLTGKNAEVKVELRD